LTQEKTSVISFFVLRILEGLMGQGIELPPYKVDEVARLMGVSEQVVRGALREGRLPAFRVGKQWLIPRGRLNRILRGETA
jgi:excisionase family DNA binding protein